MKLTLVGYMGSGKSTIGKVLAKTLNYSFIDLDSFIEKQEKNTISKIFKQKGEIYFRKKEHEFLNTLLKTNKDLIIAVGGGTPCYYNNIDLINELSISVYLKSSIKTLIKHLKPEKVNRPLIAHLDNEQLDEFVAKHLFERSYYYNKAKYKVVIDEKTIKRIIKELSSLI